MAPVRRFGSAAASETGSQNDPGVRSKAIDALTRAALAADMLDDPRTAASALDVSIQKQALNLLTNLQKKYKLSYLFITQDLAVMRAMAHRVRVMKEGRVVEAGDTPDVPDAPSHPCTRSLLASSMPAARRSPRENEDD
ncbi:ABC transporter ATP-binding protein [Burkholderia pseudomallei]|uniref:ABC transporter ATP-binding protein n=1 Tax=Burkholderia pseudomallei TaxID=28450 RepID=UPI0005100984|nr:ABC transporter ATP-binding protein [Burkholderia pseudomallei]AJX20167.1 putative aBC transporter ATP-binding protein [Burkholderia pseudomallei MSHR491]KGC75791.1 putative aBC transporter ATP-binding protein [Burkholderia pseudomallei]KGC97778.1 putative aBC transporter ATP-binding protein [Burkholderia pseudomallei]KGS37717.1 putative aBC transporter ATP-binding protein [Burkholderia pseudomallei MSHR5492]KGV20104.1 putative aBC transporter ATP-binding protein [Burkholderia pseudomallei 